MGDQDDANCNANQVKSDERLVGIVTVAKCE